MTLCKDCNRWMCGLVDKELKTKCECQEFQLPTSSKPTGFREKKE